MKVIDQKLNSLKIEFYYSIITEILNCISCDLFMSALILSMCCIDYMGVPISENKDNTKEHFKLFIKNYMSGANEKYKDGNIQDKLWAIRCSLIHTYGSSEQLKKENLYFNIHYGKANFDDHLIIDHTKRFQISVSRFVSEVISGVEKYFRENKDYDLLNNWYSKLIVASSFVDSIVKSRCIKNGKIIYEEIHPFLEILDYNPDVEIIDLSNQINKSIIDNYNSKRKMR